MIFAIVIIVKIYNLVFKKGHFTKIILLTFNRLLLKPVGRGSKRLNWWTPWTLVSCSQTPPFTAESLVYFHRKTHSGSPPTSGGNKYVPTLQVFICKVKMDASCYLCSQYVDSGTWNKKRIRLDSNCLYEKWYNYSQNLPFILSNKNGSSP